MSNILYDLSIDELIKLQNKTQETDKIIVKFSASWCAPCKKINPIVDEYKTKMKNNHYLVLIDIDESVELYISLKRFKMVNGIPAILLYNGGVREKWYIPDNSVLGGDVNGVTALLNNLFK
jgi:thioredoxin 1